MWNRYRLCIITWTIYKSLQPKGDSSNSSCSPIQSISSTRVRYHTVQLWWAMVPSLLTGMERCLSTQYCKVREIRFQNTTDLGTVTHTNGYKNGYFGYFWRVGTGIFFLSLWFCILFLFFKEHPCFLGLETWRRQHLWSILREQKRRVFLE